MKCQAHVERITSRANLRRVVLETAYGQCKRNAVAKLGDLCLCVLHTRLALEGLIDDDGQVANRGSLRDVRRYPHKFPNGLYAWARGLEPIALPPAPPLPSRRRA